MNIQEQEDIQLTFFVWSFTGEELELLSSGDECAGGVVVPLLTWLFNTGFNSADALDGNFEPSLDKPKVI